MKNKRFSDRQDKDFGTELIGNAQSEITHALRDAFSLEWVIDYIDSNFEPEEVYGSERLEEWAIDNGFVKGETVPDQQAP